MVVVLLLAAAFTTRQFRYEQTYIALFSSRFRAGDCQP